MTLRNVYIIDHYPTTAELAATTATISFQLVQRSLFASANAYARWLMDNAATTVVLTADGEGRARTSLLQHLREIYARDFTCTVVYGDSASTVDFLRSCRSGDVLLCCPHVDEGVIVGAGALFFK